MNGRDERRLLRWVTGQLPADQAAGLARRVEGDPELARAALRLRRRWLGLELPAPAPAPVGFARRVMVGVREEQEAGLSWGLAPGWVRLASAAALVAGLGLGVVAAMWPLAVGTVEAGELGGTGFSEPGPADLSLAEAYWDALESTDEPQEVPR